ncbi:B12-binding domain-containing radical SAM protein [Sandaracinus amylolyticus]|uniref:B12-binding domain-containing radical SAM protein n=1 Tax=Sandaracinus amylolyticus TaxID=927083 RepID=UPI001EEC85AD|nr:radical SAM protein [Sandaracinus amylolyticus]UJR84386.1 Hypothetical protein I5071_64650 [Sandaracinus amylolyticus]
MARLVLVTSGLEHLGIAALAAHARALGHDVRIVYEPKPFSSNSGPDNALLARLLEPTPEETAAKIAAHAPDVVGFSSYTITHGWSVEVARHVKRQLRVPIVFGGPHVQGSPAHVLREPSIDAVVEGEGEGPLADLLACVEKGRFGRADVANVWFRDPSGGPPIRNALRPLIEDLDVLPWADKRGFYEAVPAFEREFYVISRRGCPYRCSFCEYSVFPRQYPGQKPVRRRSVGDVIAELAAWKRRGVMRKVFFWDAIFTLDLKWIEEFADAYAREIALPFECYSHPQVMTREMARALARAGAAMVRVGVQTVNGDTLAEVDRRGGPERVEQTIAHLRDAGIPYALDHILALPGEGLDDQIAALRFYNRVRPQRVYTHWMTYLPGTTALERARDDGSLSEAQVERILTGDQTDGFEAPRVLDPSRRGELDDMARLSVVLDLLPVLPRRTVDWLIESRAYRFVPRLYNVRSVAQVVTGLAGDVALRERTSTMLLGMMQSARLVASAPKSPSEWPGRPAPQTETATRPRARLRVLSSG